MTFLTTFHTHLDARVFMRKAQTLGTAKLKPVPRSLSTSCGICVEFTPKDEDFDVTTLSNMEYEGFYRAENEGFELLHHKD